MTDLVKREDAFCRKSLMYIQDAKRDMQLRHLFAIFKKLSQMPLHPAAQEKSKNDFSNYEPEFSFSFNEPKLSCEIPNCFPASVEKISKNSKRGLDLRK